jgi:hypothetical protein
VCIRSSHSTRFIFIKTEFDEAWDEALFPYAPLISGRQAGYPESRMDVSQAVRIVAVFRYLRKVIEKLENAKVRVRKSWEN